MSEINFDVNVARQYAIKHTEVYQDVNMVEEIIGKYSDMILNVVMDVPSIDNVWFEKNVKEQTITMII